MTKTHIQHGMEENSDSKWTLNYFSFRTDEKSEFKYSLNPRDSDLIQNSTILGGLVGTLVKYGHSGRIEPYMTDSFHVEPGNRKWTFTLMSGLNCEDGKEINNHRFVANLTSSLRRYSDSGDALDFENLEGWSDFKEKKTSSIKGLRAEGDKNIIFSFNKSPSDLLELLRMPYFGFWCEANFEGPENKWKDDHRIISSGAYALAPSSSNNSVLLRLRNDSRLKEKESPTEILFSTIVKSEISKDYKNTIFEFSKKNDFDELKLGYQKVIGPPTMLFSLALSPFFDGPFANKRNRQIFADRIKSARREFPHFTSQFFYFNAQSKLPQRDLSKEKFKVGTQNKLTFAVASKAFSKSDLKDVELLLTTALNNSGLSYEIIVKDAHDDGWVHKVDSNKLFDGRITSVDIGGYVINAAIKMMFCSSLGINFGDPSGRIFRLVERQDISGGPIGQNYIDEFNQIIEDDAAVIPLYHYGIEWHLTPDIDTQSLPIVATEPIFEKIRRKQ